MWQIRSLNVESKLCFVVMLNHPGFLPKTTIKKNRICSKPVANSNAFDLRYVKKKIHRARNIEKERLFSLCLILYDSNMSKCQYLFDVKKKKY